MIFDEMSWLNVPDVPGTDDYAVSQEVFPFLETVFFYGVYKPILLVTPF